MRYTVVLASSRCSLEITVISRLKRTAPLKEMAALEGRLWGYIIEFRRNAHPTVISHAWWALSSIKILLSPGVNPKFPAISQARDGNLLNNYVVPECIRIACHAWQPAGALGVGHWGCTVICTMTPLPGKIQKCHRIILGLARNSFQQFLGIARNSEVSSDSYNYSSHFQVFPRNDMAV